MRGTRARWAAPVGAVAVVGIVIAASAAASAAVPSLPSRTAAQLLADVAQGVHKPTGPFTATVQQAANLGLPELPVPSGPGGASSPLTSGTQSISIWYADPQHVRVAEPAQAGESDLRRDGNTVWLWDSKNQTATEVTLPSEATGLPKREGNGAAPSGGPSASAPPVPATPEAAASQLLKAVGPSTVVGVQSNVYVADRPAYQLSIAPKSSQSLISQILIAIDASRSIPLRVEVFGRGSAGLVYSLGFSALTFGPPAATNFTFTPPPGATVNKQVIAANPGAYLRGLGLPVGSSASASAWSSPQASSLPAPSVPALSLSVGALGYGPSHLLGASPGKPTVIGSDWLSVVATPANAAVAAAVQQLLTEQRATTRHGLFGSSSSAVPAPSTSGSTVPVGPYLAPLQALVVATTPVSGTWGHGRLLQTALVSVLITSNGQILAGAVTPQQLYADVPLDAG